MDRQFFDVLFSGPYLLAVCTSLLLITALVWGRFFALRAYRNYLASRQSRSEEGSGV